MRGDYGVRCEQFNVVIVTLSSTLKAENKFSVGSKDERCTVTKLLNCYAMLSFFAPPCQKFHPIPGKNVLCIPLVHALHPPARYDCAFT
jgi:hypothetical protein